MDRLGAEDRAPRAARQRARDPARRRELRGEALIARLVAYRGAFLTLGLLGAAIGLSQVADRFGQVVMREPATFTIAPLGDDVPRLAPITVTFASAPVEREAANLFQLEPAPAGTYAWLSPRTLLFQPDYPGLLRGGTYTVRVPARPEAGLPNAVARKFTVTGQLAVQQIIPGNGDTEVPTAAQIFVQFSRSVAPLTTLAAQPTNTVVTFDPPLPGTGEWLNTSIYRFTPRELRPATTYTVRVAKGLTSAADGVLKDDFLATFTTIRPAVESIQPDANWIFCGPWQEVNVTFNQPMDASAAAGLSVRRVEGDLPVPGTVRWNDTRTMLVWNPAGRLAPATTYRIVLAGGLRGAHGGDTARARDATFTTIALPSIARTYPGDGESSAQRFGVNVQFATPMDPASLEGKLSVSGFDEKDLEGRVSTSEMYLSASVALKASTSYTVTLAPGATDRYGQVMTGHRWSFTTGALPSAVSLALPGYGSGATYSSTTDPIVFFQATNLPAITFSLYALDGDEGRRFLHDASPVMAPNWAPPRPAIRTWTEQVSGSANDTVFGSTSLTGGSPLPEGYYYLRTDGVYHPRFVFAVVDTVLVTKVTQKELLAWAVDHDSGKPLAGATIRATGAITPAERVTDENGLASFEVSPMTLGSAGGDRSYVLWIDGAGRHGYTTTRWQGGISPYQFGIPGEYYLREWVGHLYTDRPIYRPGERVEFKGIVRADDDARYSLPPTNAPFEVVIASPRGAESLREPVTLNAFGSFAGSFQIPGDTPLGDHSVSLQLKLPGGANSKTNTHHLAGSSFLVAEFRTPEFQVALTTPRASYVNGETIDASVAASFFFGGGLEGAAVRWSVTADPSFAMRVQDFERYSFSDYDYFRPNVLRESLRANGMAKTDATGIATFSVPATLQASEGAQRFVLSASVTDESGQAAAGYAAVAVHPAAYYVGVHPRHYVAREGTPALVDLVTVDTAGTIAGERAVTLKVYQREWITSKVDVPGGGRRYTSEPKDTLLATLPARTERDGTAVITFKPAKPGTLRLVAEVADEQGRVQRSAGYLWVSGRGFASWQVTNDDTLKLVADKERYEVGDTADVLVPAPFAGATALVTVERGGIMTREVRTLATNSERLPVPIVDSSVPNVFVSVVLYRAPTSTDPVPRFKVGYVELPVSTSTRALNVQIAPDRTSAKPGDTVRYRVRVSDASGEGVKSEVSVAVVDKAVLSLQDERGPDGLKAFWFQRGLGVTTSSSMSVSVNRWNDAVVEAARVGKGGSGAGGGLQGQQARQEFRNTAYWSAQLVTDDDGVAAVDVKLPDNLTTWRMQVRAMSGDSMVGEGLNELVAAQPLMIRSALPRFLRVGDAAELRVLLRNSTNAATTVNVALDADGVRIDGALARQALVSPNESVVVSWPAKATAEGTAKLSVTATGSGGLADTLVVSLPVYMDMTPETMATGGVVTRDGALEAIYLPPFADTSHGSLNVQVRSALVGTMADELRHLAPHDYENAEYVASRLIAELGVRRAQRSGGGAVTVRDGQITSDLAGLIGRQRADGGWPWCDDPLCQTDPNVTSFVLLALAEAKRDGLSVDTGVVERATRYISLQLDRPQDIAHPDLLYPSTKSLWLAAVSSAGGGASALTPARALFEQQRAKLTNWARALLVLALTEGGAKADDAMVRALLDDLASSTIPSANGNHWEDTARGGFFTNTGATGLGTLALARVRPEHMLLPQTVRWLALGRAADGWHTSIDRALGILALATYAVGTGELGGDYSYKVLLDDADVLAGLVRKGAPSADARKLPLSTLVPGKASVLEVTRDYAKPGRLYYTLDLRYTTPAKEIEALNRGLAVSREYSALDDPKKAITSVRVGEIVRVKVTVIAPADRIYVVVEDLLPAGLEAMDMRLKNIDPAVRAKLDAERAQADEKKSGGYFAPWFRWYYSPWQQAELRDDRAVLKTDRLPKGVYEYVYYARATTPGDFFVAPAHAEETYFPEVFGRSDSVRFSVVP